MTDNDDTQPNGFPPNDGIALVSTSHPSAYLTDKSAWYAVHSNRLTWWQRALWVFGMRKLEWFINPDSIETITMNKQQFDAFMGIQPNDNLLNTARNNEKD